MRFHKKIRCATGILAVLFAAPVFADAQNTYELTLKDHRFDPAQITVPAGQPVILHVKNLDAQAEEFDSGDLKTEKVIAGNGVGTIHLHALKAGRYKFEGEYHEDTAQGVLIAQ